MISGIDIQHMMEPPPGFLPVPYNGGTIYVAPDYVKDSNGMYLPMDAFEAEKYAKTNNAMLPNVPMVTAIWKAADIKLHPLPLNPGNTGDDNFYNGGITNPKWYARHDQLIKDQLAGKDLQNKLIAGHKKDLVQGRRAGRVAIYGWHRTNGTPIQPHSNVHSASYKDYSHGVRLVFPMTYKNDEWIRLNA